MTATAEEIARLPGPIRRLHAAAVAFEIEASQIAAEAGAYEDQIRDFIGLAADLRYDWITEQTRARNSEEDDNP